MDGWPGTRNTASSDISASTVSRSPAAVARNQVSINSRMACASLVDESFMAAKNITLTSLALQLFLLARPVERAEREVEEDQSHDRINQEARMIRSRIPGVAQLVCILCKEQAEEGEEKARHFEPEYAAGVNEGSTDRLAKFFGPGRDGASTLVSHLSINRGLLLHRWSFL